MAGTVTVAAAQIRPVLFSLEGSLARVLEAMTEAAASGVELIVFPETFLPYYPYFSFVEPPVRMGRSHLQLYEQAVTVPGPAVERVAAAARQHGMHVLLGINERDGGSLYNTQLLIDADGQLRLKRRKITPTYHERMVWGQGDGAGLRVVETSLGSIGALACWEHYNPLARFSLMAQGEEIHCAQFPGSLVGPIFSEQTAVTMRHHALEAGCFVICSTAWLDPSDHSRITADPSLQQAFEGGCHTAVISPEGRYLAGPLPEGEGLAIAELDRALITKRKRMMDSVGHYSRPDLLRLEIHRAPAAQMVAMAPLPEPALPHDVAPVDGSAAPPPMAPPPPPEPAEGIAAVSTSAPIHERESDLRPHLSPASSRSDASSSERSHPGRSAEGSPAMAMPGPPGPTAKPGGAAAASEPPSHHLPPQPQAPRNALGRLVTELQVQGVVDPAIPGNRGRRGGAGPSDHRALTIAGTTVMVPVYNAVAQESPYKLVRDDVGELTLERTDAGPAAPDSMPSDAPPIATPPEPRFYGLSTADGTPYRAIALLHSRDVLATTLLQTCIRFRDRSTSCQFCAIEQSLEDGRTIVRKTPEQVAEVAEAAVRLDGIRQLVMTTGTPNAEDRGARLMAETAAAVKRRVELPIQAQCEPPEDPAWYGRMKAAGVDSLGMHLEVVEEEVRRRILPGKSELGVERYFEAFEQAVAVFGRGQVSTYLLAGLGDSADTLIRCSERLIATGVYPFVVPFVPIAGTPLEHHPAPSTAFMVEVYEAVAALLRASDISAEAMAAGCARCGACSALSLFEKGD